MQGGCKAKQKQVKLVLCEGIKKKWEYNSTHS